MNDKIEENTEAESAGEPSEARQNDPTLDKPGSGQATATSPGETGAGNEAAKHLEQLLRTAADFDNYKKRAARERQDAVKYATESLLQKLIPILDNLEMALAASNQEASAQNVQALQTGITMIHQQLRSTLSDAGLSEIEATGQRFDPNLHEAVAQQESSDVPEGQVVQQLRKGYKLRDRLLRPATVIVAKKAGS